MKEGETELLLALGRVVAAFDALGVEYLKDWANRLGLADLLECALDEADLADHNKG